jgi:hypothetical protein
MPRGGFRRGSGRRPNPRALIREAAHALAGSASILYGIAHSDRPVDCEMLRRLGQAIIRDAMAAKRRLDRAAATRGYSLPVGDSRRQDQRDDLALAPLRPHGHLGESARMNPMTRAIQSGTEPKQTRGQ